MNRKTTLAAVVATALIACFGTSYPASGSDDNRVWVATLVSAEGEVQVRRQGENVWKPLAMNDRMFDGDTLRVQRRGRAALQFRNSTLMRLDQETTITIGEAKPKTSFWVQLLTGAAYFFSHAPRSLEIRTPFVNGSIEGTEFAVVVSQNEGSIAVFDGRVAMVNEHGRVVLGPRESGFAAAGKPPVMRPQVASQDMVQWAVFFPPVLGYRADDFRESPAELRAAVQAAIARREAGDASGALAALPEKLDNVRDPRVFALRAELLMSLGRYEEANAELARAAESKPDSADMLALKAMAVLISGRNGEALVIARNAAEAVGRSAGARVALSYAHQAAADLDSALVAAREALALDEGNALVRARVAELLLMQGERRAAVAEASKAVERNPSAALAHTVLGFAHLARTDRRAAQAAFEKAVALAPADPQPRLGLGLAKIRGGDLAGGRVELEIAVALDPQQSLLRSYLGKAYAEENRDALAERELSRAKVLDLNDPTPYLYDAMRKQTLNQPGEALADIQESMELNDCRAVYRSRLLLDRDLAVRGVSQARIYQDLGFSQLAFSEACRSVTIDPGNASAHRFLADAYAGMPRSEIARESELLVAQLRQPHGAGLIQPRLGEARPGVLTALSAVDPAYNEYTRLFEQDGWRGMASVFAGNQESWGQEVIAGGVFGRYALSVGQSRIMSDGWRENADIDERVQNVIGSVAVTPEFTLLSSYTRRAAYEGDTAQGFEHQDYSSDLRQRTTRETFTLGGRFVLSPKTDVIVAANRQTYRFSSAMSETVEWPVEDADGIWNESVIRNIASDLDETAWNVEAQGLHVNDTFDVRMGGGACIRRGSTLVTMDMDSESEDMQYDPIASNERREHYNLYAYTSLRACNSLRIILGAAVDKLESDVFETTRFNPKLGLLWYSSKGTTVRAAGFRVSRRPFVAQQTLEPTDVVGFQQFHDDPDGSDSWRYGIGIDQRIGARLFAGVSIEGDTSEIPVTPNNPDESVALVGRQNWLSRNYLSCAVTRRLAATIGANVFRQDSDDPLAAATSVPIVTAVWMPLSIRYDIGRRWFAKVGATAVSESLRVPEVSSGSMVEFEDRFTTVDMDIGLRLPGRHGTVGLQVRNVFDRRFGYDPTDADLPVFEPYRTVLVNMTAVF